jgi:hypothetical protein
MIEWIPLDKNSDADWNARLRSFPDRDVYYLPEYVRAFQLHGDGIPILLHYVDRGFKVVNVAMKRDVAAFPEFGGLDRGRYFELATPYGYGGFLASGDATHDNKCRFFRKYGECCRQNGVVFEFFRFHPVLNNFPFAEPELDYKQTLGRTITLPTDSPDNIMNRLSVKNRNMIRKAKRYGIVVRWGREPGLYETFRNLYFQTMSRDRASKYYFFEKDFFESLRCDLRDHHELFYAELGGEIISMAVILLYGGQMHYHLSASLAEYRNCAAGNLLIYEAACFGALTGCRIFHLGGGRGADESNGLFKFKASFNQKSETVFHIGGHIHDPAAYEKLVGYRAAHDEDFNPDNAFFPRYRG